MMSRYGVGKTSQQKKYSKVFDVNCDRLDTETCCSSWVSHECKRAMCRQHDYITLCF